MNRERDVDVSTMLPNLPAGTRADEVFAARVLDATPGPVLVVDRTGQVLHANRALLRLVGWELDEARGTNIAEHICADDRDWVTDAFIQMVGAPHVEAAAGETTWPSLNLRLVARDGSPVPVEVSATGAFADPVIGGIVYEVRAAFVEQSLRSVLNGVAHGAPIEELLSHVLTNLVRPPLNVAGAVLAPDGAGGFSVMLSTCDELTRALESAGSSGPWMSPTTEPQRCDVEELPPTMAEAMLAAGHSDFWWGTVTTQLSADSYRIVAARPEAFVPATGLMHRLVRAIELAAVVILRSQTDELLAYAATHDSLTGLSNRVGLATQASETRPVGAGTVALYLDLDGFKSVNDQHGHAAGDEALRVVGERLRRSTRPSDMVARLGGDEFVVVLGSQHALPGATVTEAAMSWAQRILDVLAAPLEIEGELVTLSASIGVVVADDEMSAEDLLARADEAMYDAKRRGGGRPHLVGVG